MHKSNSVHNATSSVGCWLRHPQDVHSILFHGLVVAGYGIAFWLYLHPETASLNGYLTRTAFITAAAILLGWISGVDVGVNFHNHCHRPVFVHQWMNRWFGRCWTIFGGWPSFFWTYAHLTVHHRRLLQAGDWTLPRRSTDGKWENFYVYCLLHWPWRYSVHFCNEFSSGNISACVRRRALIELTLFVCLWTLPFWFDFWMAIVLWLLPHWLANVYVMAPGMYVQHVGCEAENSNHKYCHSTTFLSKWFNQIMFNIGYHAEHHSHPNIHWSELPELHQALKEDLIQSGTHVVPFGYYRAGYLVSRGRKEFSEQHPGYTRTDSIITNDTTESLAIEAVDQSQSRP